MEKKIKERNLRGKVKERYIVERKDIKRKTQTCLLREAQNKSIKSQVDFESVIQIAGSLRRQGHVERLSETDREKLFGGSSTQKKHFNRYGHSLNKDILGLSPKANKNSSKSLKMENLRRSYCDQVERDIRAPTENSSSNGDDHHLL